MGLWQAFLLGVMVALTPSVCFLGVMLLFHRDEEADLTTG